VSVTPDNSTGCIRCGTCCKKGGPALHIEDRQIILEGHIRAEHLITIRRGEPAYLPGSEKIQPVPHELVKIAGKNRGWECLFFRDQESSCMVYEHRPLECRILKCWDTTELLRVTGRGLLTRMDIINLGDPAVKLIELHEEKCAVHVMEDFLSLLSKHDGSTYFKKLEEMVQEDLDIRSAAASEFTLPVALELFLLGRPLFKLLSGRGVSVHEKHGRIHLSI